MTGDFLLYGANGYVGSALAGLAVDRGLRPIIAGRNAAAVEELATTLGLDSKIVAVDAAASLDAALMETRVVLNCAGPFIYTAIPIIEACLRNGVHYVDITGEPPVYGAIAAYHDRAIEREVMLLPGAGFDVVPTDCLAVYLAKRLPSATRLTLAINQHGPAGLPPGTLNTAVEMIPFGSKQHRVGGTIVSSKERKRRYVDFGDGPVEVVLMVWGDLFTAYRSTGIPNIEDYWAFDAATIRQLDMLDRVRPLFRLAPVRAAAKRRLRGGATPDERAATTTRVWGEVVDDVGNTAVARLSGPEAGLEWTIRSALDVVSHILAGDVTPGYQTPAMAYGPDLVLESEGVTREDVESA